jgi:hypothetical protein
VAAAAQTGAQNPAPAAGQPVNTGDQGTTNDGQSLPGSTGSNMGGSGTPTRSTPTPTPTPTPIPTPTPAS